LLPVGVIERVQSGPCSYEGLQPLGGWLSARGL